MTVEAHYDPNAEKGLISAFLSFPMEVGSGTVDLPPEAFHGFVSKTLFVALHEMWKDNAAIDLVTLTSKLLQSGQLESVGGGAAVSEFFNYGTPAHAPSYTETIRRKYAVREIIRVCARSLEAALQHDAEPELLEDILANLSEISAPSAKKVPTNKQMATEVMDELQRTFDNRQNPSDVLSTSFSELDQALGGGLRPDDYILLTGPTKGGKSILAQNIMENLWAKYRRTVLTFSLEMGYKSLVYRIFASTGRTSLTRMRNGWMNEGDFPAITAACVRFSESRMLIRDDARTLGSIVAIARQTKARFPDLAAICVDYVQLIQRAMQKGESREQVVAEISTTLRNLQLELGVAIIVLSQENKAGDARESMRLEQDCTLRIKIEMAYEQDGKGKATSVVDSSMRNIAIPLARNGPPCEFQLAFLGEQARFENPRS